MGAPLTKFQQGDIVVFSTKALNTPHPSAAFLPDQKFVVDGPYGHGLTGACYVTQIEGVEFKFNGQLNFFDWVLVKVGECQR